MSTVAPTKFHRFLQLPKELQLQIWYYAALASSPASLNLDTSSDVELQRYLFYANPVYPAWFKDVFGVTNLLAALMSWDGRNTLLSTCYLSRIALLKAWKRELEEVRWMWTPFIWYWHNGARDHRDAEMIKDQVLALLKDMIEGRNVTNA